MELRYGRKPFRSGSRSLAFTFVREGLKAVLAALEVPGRPMIANWLRVVSVDGWVYEVYWRELSRRVQVEPRQGQPRVEGRRPMMGIVGDTEDEQDELDAAQRPIPRRLKAG